MPASLSQAGGKNNGAPASRGGKVPALPWGMNSPRLVAVMPVYNEEANIASVVTEWMECLGKACPDFQLITLNDGSRDATGPVLDELAARFGARLQVVHKSNSGHGRTCRQGYDLAVAAGAKWIFQLDSDGQCDPAYFADMWEARQDSDCVFGFRRSRGDGLGRLIVSRGCRALLFLATGTWMRDANVPYRLMRGTVLARALEVVPPDFDIQNIAVTYALSQQPRLRWIHHPIHFRARQGGENSINFRKIARMGFHMLRDFSRVRARENWLVTNTRPAQAGAH